jgi:DNA-binding CsgD family transcriptional regulator
MAEIKKFIEWLSFHPTSDEIARALVTEYLAADGVSCIRFGRIQSDDSAMVLGQYGYPDANDWKDKIVPGSEWRTWDLPAIDIITGKNKSKWSPDAKTCVVSLRDRGVIQGNVVLEFSKSVSESDQHRVLNNIEDLCVPIALYLSFQNRAFATSIAGINVLSDSRDTGTGQLTQRQILILRGMVEGKTNHELATEMGFSVSTIRHETMRIYQALAVSDRKEAAKKALMLSLI